MADSKISALTALAAAPASGDLLVMVDVSDTTMAASGTDKKITYANLTSALTSGATTFATASAQTFTNGVNVTTGRIGVGTTSPTHTIEAVVSNGATQANITATTYGVNGGGILHGQLANGTLASPTKVTVGQIVGGFGSRAYHGGGAFQTSSPASIHMVAAETQESSAFGMYLRFLTTPLGTTVRQERTLITHDGTLWTHDTGTFDPLVAAQTKPVGDVLCLVSAANGGSTSVSFGAFAYGNSSPTAGYRGGQCSGSAASPGATAADKIICYMGGHVHDGTNWSAGTRAFMAFKSAEIATPTAQGTYMTLETTPIGSVTRAERVRIAPTGYVGVGVTSPTSLLHVAASTTDRSSVCVNVGTAPATPVVGDIWNDGALSFYNADATTNAIVNHLRLRRNSTGTAAAGFGLGIIAELESSTTDAQSAGRLTWEWATATHASRTAKGKLTAYYTSTEREAITWVADSTSVSVGINTSTPGRMLDVVGSDIYIRAYKDADEYTELRSLGVIYATRGANTFSIDAQYGGVGTGGPAAIINNAAIKMSGNDGSYPNQLYLTADGKVGLNTAAPSGLLHGHDGSGGFLFVNRASVGGTLVTVIPDAAGDVTEKIFFVGWCTNSAPFSADVAPTTLTVSSSTTKTDGVNTLTIAVTAGGAFTLQATAGAATWNVNLWVFWR